MKTFDLLTFKYNNQAKKYVPELPLTHDSCIHKVIDYVIQEAGKHVYHLSYEVKYLKSIKSRSFTAVVKNL